MNFVCVALVSGLQISTGYYFYYHAPKTSSMNRTHTGNKHLHSVVLHQNMFCTHHKAIFAEEKPSKARTEGAHAGLQSSYFWEPFCNSSAQSILRMRNPTPIGHKPAPPPCRLLILYMQKLLLEVNWERSRL